MLSMPHGKDTRKQLVRRKRRSITSAISCLQWRPRYASSSGQLHWIQKCSWGHDEHFFAWLFVSVFQGLPCKNMSQQGRVQLP